MENCGLWFFFWCRTFSHCDLIVWIVSISVKRFVYVFCPCSLIYNATLIKFGRPLVSIRSIHVIVILTQISQSYDTWFVFLSAMVDSQLNFHDTGLQ